MLAFDTNVLVYAHRAETPLHGLASEAVRSAASSPAQWGIPWPCLHEFLGVVTNVRAFRQPTPVDLALHQLETWLESPSLVMLGESANHLAVVSDLIRTAHISGPMIHDARIAAICLSHGVSALVTMDRDFARFPTLRTRSLLA